MRGASPFLTKLGSGVCRVDSTAGTTDYLLNGGFAQMNHNTLVLLADGAELVSSIDPDQALKQSAEADAKVTAVGGSPRTLTECEAIEQAQTLARARLAAARRR